MNKKKFGERLNENWSIWEMKIPVLLPNGTFGYLTNVCNCDECKNRGQAEFELFDEKGRYIQHVKYSELKDREIIEHYNPYDLCDLLHEKLMKD